MVTIELKPNTWELTITGHAGHGKKGKDIVCASVSMLFYTLGEALYDSVDMLEEAPVFKDEEGEGYLSCKPKKEYVGNIARSYWTIMEGFQLLANEYKKNVCLKIVK